MLIERPVTSQNKEYQTTLFLKNTNFLRLLHIEKFLKTTKDFQQILANTN